MSDYLVGVTLEDELLRRTLISIDDAFEELNTMKNNPTSSSNYMVVGGVAVQLGIEYAKGLDADYIPPYRKTMDIDTITPQSLKISEAKSIARHVDDYLEDTNVEFYKHKSVYEIRIDDSSTTTLVHILRGDNDNSLKRKEIDNGIHQIIDNGKVFTQNGIDIVVMKIERDIYNSSPNKIIKLWETYTSKTDEELLREYYSMKDELANNVLKELPTEELSTKVKIIKDFYDIHSILKLYDIQNEITSRANELGVKIPQKLIENLPKIVS